MFIIVDWANNVCFKGIKFKSFDDAEEFLSEKLSENYSTDRQEYYIVMSKDIRNGFKSK